MTDTVESGRNLGLGPFTGEVLPEGPTLRRVSYFLLEG